MSKQELVSAAEVARLTGRDVATVARWAGNGKLVHAFKGEGKRGAYIFKRADVDALMETLNKAKAEPTA